MIDKEGKKLTTLLLSYVGLLGRLLKFTFHPFELAKSPSCSRQAGPKKIMKKNKQLGEKRGGRAVLPM